MHFFKKIKEIKKTEGDIIEIKRFLSLKEVKTILNYNKKNKNYFVNRNDGSKSAFNRIIKKPVRSINKWHPKIKNILLPKINNLFKDVNFYVHSNEFPPHIFKSYYPLKIHADTGKNNSEEVPFKQILIPLYINKNSKNVFTIFFKNRWYGPAANFRYNKTITDPLEIVDKNKKFIRINNLKHFLYYLIKEKKQKYVIYNKGNFFNNENLRKKIKNLINKKRYNITTSKFINRRKKFSLKIYKKYLTHEDYNDFIGLKFWKAIKWKVGNAIIWDRNIIHSSNNFIKFNVSSKIGLSVFLNRKV